MPPRPRRADPATVRLPADLAGPVDVELTHAIETIPTRFQPGSLALEPKWDGYRISVVRSGSGAKLWSRQRNDLTERFPDIAAAAAAQLPAGVVLDGEIVISIDGKLNFDALQRRLVTSPAKASAIIDQAPASYVAFDLLAMGGVDLRTQRWTVRRARLEDLAATWRLPFQLTPVTYDLDEAQEWFEVLPEAMGIEGLVIKPTSSRYVGGRRSHWAKVKQRATVDVIAGAITGSLRRPEVVICGRYRGKVLEIVGRTVPLSDAQAAELAPLLKAAGARHPWPDEIGPGHWGRSAKKVAVVKVRPHVVIEVAADAAKSGDHWRHPLRFQRYRADLEPGDVEELE